MSKVTKKTLQLSSRFLLRVGIVKQTLPVLHALLLFLSYIALVNDLGLRFLITVNMKWKLEKLYIYFPFLKSIIIAITILMLIIQLLAFENYKRAIITISLMTILLIPNFSSIPFLVPIVAIASVLLIILNKKIVKNPKSHLKEVINIGAIIVSSICLYSIIRYLIYIIIGGRIFSDSSWSIVILHMKLLASLQLINMITYATMPIIAVISLIRKHKEEEHNELINKKQSLLILLISILWTILQTSIIYLPTVNPTKISVGIDLLYYEEFLLKAIKRGPEEALNYSPGRFLYLLLIYLVWYCTRLPPRLVVQSMPILLFPIMILSSYFMVFKLTNSYTIAAISSLILASSPQVTMNYFASYQANVLGLILMYTIIGLYFTKIKLTPLLILIISTLMQFVHPWTSFQMLTSFTLFILLAKKYKDKHSLATLIMMGIGILLGDQMKIFISHSITEASVDIADYYTKISLSNAFNNILTYHRNLYRAIMYYCKGSLNYPLSVFTLITLFITSAELKAFGVSWILPLVITYVSSRGYIARLILNLPIHTLIAISIFKLSKNKILPITLILISLSYSLMYIITLF